MVGLSWAKQADPLSLKEKDSGECKQARQMSGGKIVQMRRVGLEAQSSEELRQIAVIGTWFLTEKLKDAISQLFCERNWLNGKKHATSIAS